MLFKTCYCPDLWKYDQINYAFNDVRLEQYYSNTKCCQKHGCVCAITASRLTGFTGLAKAELFLKDFFLNCALTGITPYMIATDSAFAQTKLNMLE